MRSFGTLVLIPLLLAAAPAAAQCPGGCTPPGEPYPPYTSAWAFDAAQDAFSIVVHDSAMDSAAATAWIDADGDEMPDTDEIVAAGCPGLFTGSLPPGGGVLHVRVEPLFLDPGTAQLCVATTGVVSVQFHGG